MESSKSLLVLSTSERLTKSKIAQLKEFGMPLALQMGMTLAVLPGGLKAEVHSDNSELIKAIVLQTDAIRDLVLSNRALISALADEATEDDGERPIGVYLDGAPVR